jgi:septal ring factor EnvC (AmiA/AmiB activator)
VSNVVEFSKPTNSEKKAQFFLKESKDKYCPHIQVTICEQTQLIECAKCKKTISAFEYLLLMARTEKKKWDGVEQAEKELELVNSDISRLKKERTKLSSEVKRLRTELYELEMEQRKARSSL